MRKVPMSAKIDEWENSSSSPLGVLESVIYQSELVVTILWLDVPRLTHQTLQWTKTSAIKKITNFNSTFVLRIPNNNRKTSSLFLLKGAQSRYFELVCRSTYKINFKLKEVRKQWYTKTEKHQRDDNKP